MPSKNASAAAAQILGSRQGVCKSAGGSRLPPPGPGARARMPARCEDQRLSTAEVTWKWTAAASSGSVLARRFSQAADGPLDLSQEGGVVRMEEACGRFD